MQDHDKAIAVVGAYMRIKSGSAPDTLETLSQLPGVESFDVGCEDRVGVVIEAANAHGAEEILTDIADLDDVLGVWPVSIELEEFPDSIDTHTTASHRGENHDEYTQGFHESERGDSCPRCDNHT